MSLENSIKNMAKKAKASTKQLRAIESSQKDEALHRIAAKLIENQSTIIMENEKDLTNAKKAGLSPAMIDRLTLNEKVIKGMANGLKEIIALPDPIGAVPSMWKRPNGLTVGRVRIPLGVIGFIYESRPNVTVDASALCLKSGNAVILKGGSEAIHSNIALAKLQNQALQETGIPQEAIQVIPSIDREAVGILIGLEEYLDIIIPRGGEGLIRYVSNNSRVPVLKHYKGVCHVYVDEFADKKMAENICFNAKVNRPGVCNAMETMLVHERIANKFLPTIAERLKGAGVEIRGCEKTLKIIKDATPAQESDWPEEFLDLILAVRIVPSMDEALNHIEKYGSNHTEAIVTNNYERSQQFLVEADASAVLINASTRFNDGNQLGLGAEIGINTSKLHAFGPMGLEELTTTKFIIYGQGHIRT